MSDDTLNLIRAFRRDIPDADGAIEARVLRRVSDRQRLATGRAPRLNPRVVAPLAAVVLVLVGVALLAPWHRGPASVPAAEAARVLRGAVVALTPRPGWVFHERVQLDQVVPGTTKTRVGVRELWIVNAQPFRYRQTVTNMGYRGTVESGGTAGKANGYVWDAATKALYDATLRGRLFVPAALSSASWRASITRAVRSKEATVVGKSVIDGRSVYEIDSGAGQSRATIYVDAETYAPIEVESPGLSYLDGYWFGKAQHYTAYEYLPPTSSNLERANIIATHRPAPVAPASSMPALLRQQLTPVQHTRSAR